MKNTLEVDALVQLITNIGFPIVACIALFYKMDKQDKAHKEEVDKLSETICNNTLAMEKIISKIGG